MNREESEGVHWRRRWCVLEKERYVLEREGVYTLEGEGVYLKGRGCVLEKEKVCTGEGEGV